MSVGRATRPDVSIIVPIAPGRAPLVLDSLEGVASNGVCCEILTSVGPNPSRNRNQAIRRARAPILAFTDDDCQVAPDWLASGLAFLRAHPEYDAVGGPQLNTDNESAVARASGYALASRFGTFRLHRRYKPGRRRLSATECDLTSANLFVTRRAFDTWGPFNEHLWPNEETALLHRIEAAGGRIAYDPGIVVFHKRRGSLLGLARQCFGYGRGRARQARIQGPRRPRLEQAVPSLFLVYLVLLPLLVSVSPAALAPLALHAVIGVALSVRTAVTRADPVAALLMPLAFLTIHAAYPAGFLVEAASPQPVQAEHAAPEEGTAVTP